MLAKFCGRVFTFWRHRHYSPLPKCKLQWRYETRSGWLRFSVIVVLVLNLLVSGSERNLLIYAQIVCGYTVISASMLVLASIWRSQVWTVISIIVDAVLVVALLHEHLLGSDGNFDHQLTTPSLAVAFLLLGNTALYLVPRLVVLFTSIVVTGWLSLIVVMAHSLAALTPLAHHVPTSILSDAALAVAFTLAAFVAFLITHDHTRLLKQAMDSENRRQNLSRFFSPLMVSDLEAGQTSLDLKRRDAAVMFVDLRSFTLFAEQAHQWELTELLADYRHLVTQAVFEAGGTVDKFIGDGVMAVFGQPKSKPDDTKRALECALRLVHRLSQWKVARHQQGKPSLDAGIGLHIGSVFGGILQSGQHDEFTVFGDAVNVAERLERLTKSLGASLVVSTDVLERAGPIKTSPLWKYKDNVELDGRTGLLKISYLARMTDKNSTLLKTKNETSVIFEKGRNKSK